jgi:hypothetical protein
MGNGSNIRETNAQPKRWAHEGSNAFGREVQIVKDEIPTRIDQVSDSLIFLGWAEFGALEDEPVWKIRRIQQFGTVWEQRYAADPYGSNYHERGNEFFRFNWSERYMLDYL